jgi:hypothetical protein
MNRQFQLKNKIVDELLSERCGLGSQKDLNENIVGDVINIVSNPLYSVIRAILGGQPEETPRFNKPDDSTINPEQLKLPAPRTRYTTTPGFQLSRASTIA